MKKSKWTSLHPACFQALAILKGEEKDEDEEKAEEGGPATFLKVSPFFAPPRGKAFRTDRIRVAQNLAGTAFAIHSGKMYALLVAGHTFLLLIDP